AATRIFARECRKLPLSTAFKRRIRVAEEMLYVGSSAERTVASSVRVHSLMQALSAELTRLQFLLVPSKYRLFVERNGHPFGATVGDRLYEANEDIAAAGRCLAVGEWTASVFHSMRVLEHALQLLADGLSIAHSCSLDTVIDRIEGRIAALRE